MVIDKFNGGTLRRIDLSMATRLKPLCCLGAEIRLECGVVYYISGVTPGGKLWYRE